MYVYMFCGAAAIKGCVRGGLRKPGIGCACSVRGEEAGTCLMRAHQQQDCLYDACVKPLFQHQRPALGAETTGELGAETTGHLGADG